VWNLKCVAHVGGVTLSVLQLSVACASVTVSLSLCQTLCEMSSSLGPDNDSTEYHKLTVKWQGELESQMWSTL
jgi:hypothetical protein